MNLETLWDRVLLGLENALDRDHDEDEAGMNEASDEDLIMWCDDLRDRVGVDVTAMREAMGAYIAERARATNLPYANRCAMPYRNPTAWAAMFARVHATGADGVIGHYAGRLYLSKDARFIGTIPMTDSDREVWA